MLKEVAIYFEFGHIATMGIDFLLWNSKNGWKGLRLRRRHLCNTRSWCIEFQEFHIWASRSNKGEFHRYCDSAARSVDRPVHQDIPKFSSLTNTWCLSNLEDKEKELNLLQEIDYLRHVIRLRVAYFGGGRSTWIGGIFLI